MEDRKNLLDCQSQAEVRTDGGGRSIGGIGKRDVVHWSGLFSPFFLLPLPKSKPLFDHENGARRVLGDSYITPVYCIVRHQAYKDLTEVPRS